MKQSISRGSVLQLRFQPTENTAAVETAITVRSVSYDGPGLRICSNEVGTREQAERLVGTTVSVDRSSLPDLQDSEFYDVDLLGARVHTETGVEVGLLADILATGANDVYVVRRSNATEVLVPAVAGSVISVDTKAHRIVIDHRLIDENGDDA